MGSRGGQVSGVGEEAGPGETAVPSQDLGTELEGWA